MTRDELQSAVSSRVMICDGAMGTLLMARGLESGACGEAWNVERPGDVAAIHRSYVEAGCDLVITNTFGGTTGALERHGLAGRADALNLAGAAVARTAAGGRAVVLGDIGPFGGFLEPVGDAAEPDVRAMFDRQVAALRAGGADGIVVETMADPRELALAVRAARAAGDWPVVATYAFGRSGDGGDGSAGFRTMMGTTVEQAVGAAIDAGADVVGANCGSGLTLDDYLRLAAALVAAAGSTPVILQPNAGAPQATGGGAAAYAATPADMARLVGPLIGAGVRIIGGCCGTTPSHLRAMAAAARGG
jgi:5-methyltetrahydrofolate--homocysteine methyltransferase